MVAMRYLLLAVTLACFVGGGLSDPNQVLMKTENYAMAEVRKDIQDLSSLLRSQASEIQDLKKQLKAALNPSGTVEMIQNNTIEERVALLELQMTDVQEDVNYLLDDKFTQDAQILNLEEDTNQIENDVESLQVTTLSLEFQVTDLENRTNSSEVRLETLEETVGNHESRITGAEGNIEDLQGMSDDQEIRLTAAEEDIQALQSTDLDHDARITSLEEYETIAFHAVLTSYDTIPENTNVVFNHVVLNQGNGYDSSTGVFTIPSGGGGVYYFSTYLLVEDGENGIFSIRLNDDVICTADGDHDNGGDDYAQATCSAVVNVVEGDEVKLMLFRSTDDTPLYLGAYYTGFNGFRI